MAVGESKQVLQEKSGTKSSADYVGQGLQRLKGLTFLVS
ncbi:hypothetical protein EVA_12074 [gut metagenome]|uniref:Uncharacterized protein n=1 Tax=gut metagenome TaxID=749906 RepID=J9FYZ8_9ZZZZ